MTAARRQGDAETRRARVTGHGNGAHRSCSFRREQIDQPEYPITIGDSVSVQSHTDVQA